MAYGSYQIGSFSFAGMRDAQTLSAPVERLRIEQRPGVDGIEITQLGKAGQTARLVTFRDLPSWSDGFSLFEDYRALIGAGPQGVTINGFSLATLGFRVIVLDVEKLAHYPTTLVAGNKLEENPQAVLECAWTVLSRAI